MSQGERGLILSLSQFSLHPVYSRSELRVALSDLSHDTGLQDTLFVTDDISARCGITKQGSLMTQKQACSLWFHEDPLQEGR